MKGTLEEYALYVRKTVVDADIGAQQIRFHELRVMGETVKAARILSNMTLVEAAARLGMSLTVYRALEKGNRLPGFQEIRNLERVFWRVWPLVPVPEGISIPVGSVVCEWSEDQFGLWDTGCGNVHQFHVGDPSENKYMWCPYCGSRVSATGYFQKQESEGRDE